MARKFDVPEFYKSRIVSRIKETRRLADPLKKDLSPSVLDFGPVRFKLARHFGFCYGVENAVEIAYRTLDEHADKRIFLLSEMIHNSHVNEDLVSRGIRFMRTTQGEQLIPFDELTPDDVVIIPAFGTTLEIENELATRGLDIKTFNTTCPFVEKVWKRSNQIGRRSYTVIVHGKRLHEETRATFSHAQDVTSVVVIRDLREAELLADIIRGNAEPADFYTLFENRYSSGFDPSTDLDRIGVVNQTTMLASETSEIARTLKRAMQDRFGSENIDEHFADTSDTLCYATNENQSATQSLVESGAHLAIVVGGVNSSNTSHLVEICSETLPTYFISGAEQIGDRNHIEHFDLTQKDLVSSNRWLPDHQPTDIILTAGASCPDILLDRVMMRILGFYEGTRTIDRVVSDFSEVVS